MCLCCQSNKQCNIADSCWNCWMPDIDGHWRALMDMVVSFGARSLSPQNNILAYSSSNWQIRQPFEDINMLAIYTFSRCFSVYCWRVKADIYSLQILTRPTVSPPKVLAPTDHGQDSLLGYLSKHRLWRGNQPSASKKLLLGGILGCDFLQLPIYCSLYVNTSLQWWFWMFLEWKIPAVKLSELHRCLMSGPGQCRIVELCQTKRYKKDQKPILVFNTERSKIFSKVVNWTYFFLCDDYLGLFGHMPHLLPANGQGLQTIPRDTRVSGCLCHCATIALETPCHALCTL